MIVVFAILMALGTLLALVGRLLLELSVPLAVLAWGLLVAVGIVGTLLVPNLSSSVRVALRTGFVGLGPATTAAFILLFPGELMSIVQGYDSLTNCFVNNNCGSRGWPTVALILVVFGIIMFTIIPAIPYYGVALFYHESRLLALVASLCLYATAAVWSTIIRAVFERLLS